MDLLSDRVESGDSFDADAKVNQTVCVVSSNPFTTLFQLLFGRNTIYDPGVASNF